MGKTLILIIDMQNGFQNVYTKGLDQKILRFLDRLEEEDANVLVAGTCYVNHEQTACYRFEGWKACMAGTKEARILDSLRPRMQWIFQKDKYSCWNGEMRQFVRENGVEKVYFTGVNTGCCVLHSAFDFYNDLVDCSVIEDLCASTSGVREHEAALIVLKSCITKERVIVADQAVEEILRHQSMTQE
ncbi:MAG: cysteine hydrolase [Clostridiales bacterium]|nr:cysteine hydrolase [Clostridiales bacterium]